MTAGEWGIVVPGDEQALFGLDETGLAVFRAAAGHHRATIEMLADRAGLPVEKVTAEVDRLAGRGLLRKIDEGWEAQDPSIALYVEHATRERALEAREAALVAQRTALYRSRLLSDYVGGRRRPDNADGVAAILDPHQVWVQIAELVENATTQIGFLLSGPTPPRPAAVDMLQGLARAAGRGVRVASVWTPDQVAAARALGGGRLPAVGWVRQSALVPMRVMIVDGREAVLPVDPDDLGQGALLVRAPGPLAVISDLVERVHKDAQPLNGPRPPADGSEQARRGAVLALLAQGHTDQAVADRLGITPRTVRRDVADLYVQHGVTSRFQLGAITARLGLLPPPRR
ncbi:MULTISPECIES: helix-turn-helix transcriptional regulator [Pseudofrankia]|uniref:helix-turn-helix transcriptional regulator n=1 Tax=Pseudofrankia TaxID=2994363 RepID=UPI001E403164|nr:MULTISPECIES: helix-turn-helix domain-containing protein [Pseudofrankia]